MVRVISLSDKAYQLLSKRKGDRSFSELVEELVENEEGKGSVSKLTKFFGILSAEEAGEMKKSSKELRKNFKARELGL